MFVLGLFPSQQELEFCSKQPANRVSAAVSVLGLISSDDVRIQTQYPELLSMSSKHSAIQQHLYEDTYIYLYESSVRKRGVGGGGDGDAPGGPRVGHLEPRVKV